MIIFVEPEYKGCYKDQEKRDFELTMKKRTGENGFTPISCAAACRTQASFGKLEQYKKSFNSTSFFSALLKELKRLQT